MSQRAIPERLYNLAEFEQMPESYERFELIEGSIAEKPVPKVGHNLVVRKIMRAYDKFDPDEQPGMMLQETNVSIAPDYSPIPDLSFWVASRAPKKDMLTAHRPDLAIEVQSLDQSLSSLTKKAKAYQMGRVRLVWLIQSSKKIVTVFYDGQDTPVTIQPTGVLDGEDVIPGFKLSVQALFE